MESFWVLACGIIFVAIFLLIAFVSVIKIVPDYKRIVIFRLGRVDWRQGARVWSS